MNPRQPRTSAFSLFRAAPLLFLRSFVPLLRVAFEKQFLGFLDRFGDPYRSWQREFEPRPGAAASEVLPVRVAFVFPAGLSPDELRATAYSLAGQTSGAWEAFFRSPEALSAAGLEVRRCKALAGPARISDPAGLISAAVLTRAGWVVAVTPGVRYAPWLVERLAALDETRAALVYWDEDVWDGKTARSRPFFKPAWSPEFWLSLDILHQSAAAHPALLALAALDGQVRPLPALLAFGQAPLHLPAVLSHLPVPAWENLGQVEAHRADTAAWLAGRGLAGARFAQVEDSAVLRPAWTVSRPELVSIIIPSRDHLPDLTRCLDSIFSLTAYPAFEIILVDNQSQAEVRDVYAALQREHANLHVQEYDRPFNINAAWNLGASQAQGGLLLFLNNDTQVLAADWLEELARAVQIPGVGIAGARLEYPDGTLQHSGIVLGMTGHANHLWIGEAEPPPWPCGPALALRDVSAVTGACLMIRSEVFERVGRFDEAYELVFSDVAICLKARELGYRTVLNPFARLLHFEGRSRARYIPAADIRRAAQEFLPRIEQGDPFYNPNLSLARTRPSFLRKIEMPASDRLEAVAAFSELRNRAEAGYLEVPFTQRKENR